MLFFFFKQKTAYEMRISDWSSDVCSSDLEAPKEVPDPDVAAQPGGDARRHLMDGPVGLDGEQIGDPDRTDLGHPAQVVAQQVDDHQVLRDRKSTRLNSSH